MLTIPNTVQNLFKTDGTRKNLRIHFPNGEIADITNENIVYESLKFTESVCSQDPFKFGLAEASVVEFETVGIANMYGYVIEVGIEIDTTSLTAAQIAAIEGDEGDGTLVKAADSDIGFGYYRVPLGAFRVESCPRDHQAMTHRKVTAYSLGRESEYRPNPYETGKLAMMIPSASTYEPNAKSLFAATFGWNDADFMTYLGYTKHEEVPWNYLTTTNTRTLKKADQTAYTATFGGPHYALTSLWNDGRTAMLAVDTHGEDYIGVLNDVVAHLETLQIDAVTSGYNDLYEAAEDLLAGVYAPCIAYSATIGGTTYTVGFGEMTENNEAVYPFRGGLNGATISMAGRVQIPFGTREFRVRQGATVIASEDYAVGTQATVYTLTDNAPATALDTMPIQIFSSGKTTKTYGSKKAECYAFDNIDLLDFAKGYLEIMARFAKRNRDGGLTIIGLDNSSPISVTPDEIDEMWWDEYNVDPIGRVLFNSVYPIGDGASIYDMTDNGALKLLAGENIAYIGSLLKGVFKPNAGNIGFTPLEMTMEGLPWVEAGDAIQATTEDNLTVDSFALRIEMTGIQNLKLYIESKGGEIIS